MTWAIAISLIEQYGIPLALYLWKKSEPSPQGPQQADWDEITALAADTVQAELIAALKRKGIALDDPKAKALLDLIQPK